MSRSMMTLPTAADPSGMGRELGMAALDHYTESKMVFFSER